MGKKRRGDAKHKGLGKTKNKNFCACRRPENRRWPAKTKRPWRITAAASPKGISYETTTRSGIVVRARFFSPSGKQKNGQLICSVSTLEHYAHIETSSPAPDKRSARNTPPSLGSSIRGRVGDFVVNTCDVFGRFKASKAAGCGGFNQRRSRDRGGSPAQAWRNHCEPVHASFSWRQGQAHPSEKVPS